MRVVKRNKTDTMIASLEDETQQPALRTSSVPPSSPPRPASLMPEPTLLNDPVPTSTHTSNSNGVPPTTDDAMDVDEDAAAGAAVVDTMEESDRLTFDTRSPGRPAIPLPAVEEGAEGEEQGEEQGEGEREGEATSPAVNSFPPSSPPKRSSPVWRAVPTSPRDYGLDRSGAEGPEVEEDQIDETQEGTQNDTDLSEPPTSAPQDDTSVPTPVDSPAGSPDFSRPAPLPPTNVTSPMKRLTQHAVPLPLEPTLIHQSLARRSFGVMKTPSKRPQIGLGRATRTPPREPESDDFTAGMVTPPRPQKLLAALFEPPVEEDEEEPRTQLEQTYVSQPGPSTESGSSKQPSSNASASLPQDTYIDEEPPQRKPATPPRPRGFGNLLPVSPSVGGSQQLPFSDVDESLGARVSDDETQLPDLQATQVRSLPSQSPERPGSVLFSLVETPVLARPLPPLRARSTIPAIPDGRRLQRRARTSVSEGQQSAVNLRLPVPPVEPTFVDQVAGTMPAESASVSASANGRPSNVSPASPALPPPVQDSLPPKNALTSSRFSPNKYGKALKGRKRVASNDSPEDADEEDAGSDSSSSAPEDPEDRTYLNPPDSDTLSPPLPDSPSLPSLPLSPKKAAVPVPKKKKTPAAPLEPAPIPAPPPSTARVSRDKRKALESSPELSGPSSGSAPEDVEDFTYRPPLKGKGKGKAKAPARPAKRAKTSTLSRSRATASRSASARPAAAATPRAAATPTTPGLPTPPVSTRDGPVRVLAMWQNEYFAATIYGRSKTGFKVQFDDGDKATVPLQRMRILELKPGEPVRDGTGSTVDLLVQVPFDGTTDEVQVLDSSSEPTTIPIRSLVVPPAVIEQRFGRRMLNAGDLNTRFPLVAPARNTAAAAATATDDDRLPFENQIFLISRGETRLSTDSVKKQILQNGGTVIDAWQDLFTIHKASYELKTELVPFIIYMGDKNVMPIKVMVALATGIPILTKKYVEDTLDATQDADWRCYLMPAGESAYMHQKNSRVLWVSQMVDPNWGEESWVAKDARGIRQAFKGLNVLFVEPTTAKHEEIKTLVPFCLMALGAKVRTAASIPANLNLYDFVMIEDREKITLTREQRSSRKLANTAWLKACLPVGKFLAPALISTAE